MQALYVGLQQMLHARSQWAEWGAQSATIVRRHFDWPVVAQQTMDAYRQAL
jgi:hypothetical protein